MDPQEPITNTPTPPVEEPVVSEVPKTTKDTNTITVVSMAIFVLLSIGAVAFLYYQNQQLKSMLASYQTPMASSTPTAKTDPTVDWKTYTDKSNRFSFKYPSTLQLSEVGNKLSLVIDDYIVQIDPNGAYQWGEGMSKDEIDKLYMKAFQYPDKPELKMYPDSAVLFYIEFKSVAEKNSAQKTIETLDQIISTFKFIDNPILSDKDKIEEAAKKAFVNKIGQEPTTKYGLSNESFKTIGDWAFGIITVAPVGEGAGPGANYFLARKINNNWEAVIEYTQIFKEWLKISPDGLVNSDLKKALL